MGKEWSYVLLGMTVTTGTDEKELLSLDVVVGWLYKFLDAINEDELHMRGWHATEQLLRAGARLFFISFVR